MFGRLTTVPRILGARSFWGFQSLRSTNAMYHFSSQSRFFHSSRLAREETYTVTFVDKEGGKRSVPAKFDQSILEVAQEQGIDEIEGACEGTCTCSTCHIILSEALYDKLGEPGDEELDMLDLAIGVTDTSRLGCQVYCGPDIDKAELQLPEEVHNFY